MTELYRFVQLRPTQEANSDDLYLVRAWSTPPTGNHQQLAEVAFTRAMEQVARAWLANDAYEPSRRRLRALQDKLRFILPTVTAKDFRHIATEVFGSAETLAVDRRIAGDDLCAAMVVPEFDTRARDAAQQRLILAATAQNVLGNGEKLDDAALARVLTHSVTILPPDVFSRASTRPPPSEGPILHTDVCGPTVSAGEPGGDIVVRNDRFEDRRRLALEELGALIRSPDAVETFTAPAAAPPAGGPQMLRQPATAGPEGADMPAIAVRPIVRHLGAEMIAPITARRLVLTSRTRANLSPSTQALLDQVAPDHADLLEIAGLLDRAQPMLRMSAAAMMASDPTAGFADGFGATRAPVDGLVRPPGVGDLLVVRERHKSYVPGAIAHIENVLASEEHERVHRRLNRSEEIVVTEGERIESEDHDLRSTNRFELATEAQRAVEDRTQLQIGLKVSGSYGPVSATASFGYTSSTARSESAMVANTTAQETVNSAVKKVTERTRTLRQTTTLNEIEETNRHKLGGLTSNFSGIYRYVDEVKSVGVFNYGTRIMVEAHVPEPGAWLAWTGTRGTAPQPPPVPTLPIGGPLMSPDQLTPGNYLAIAGAQQAVVDPPPELYVTVGMALNQEYQKETPGPQTPAFLFYKADKTLKTPEGYQADVVMGALYASAWKFDCKFAIGSHTVADGSNTDALPLLINMPMAGEVGEIPVAFTIYNAWGYTLSLNLVCKRTDRAFQKWQLATFTAIQQAYEKKRSAFDEEQRAASIAAGVGIKGNNPAINRQIERAELKRQVTSLLAGSTLNRFGAIDTTAPNDEPFVDAPATVGQGSIIAFYEQAFEWEQMTYILYPYFWARHNSWLKGFSDGEDPDPLHQAFMTAGVARTVVPVRPGFEWVALHFLSTGQIWAGGRPPQIGDPLYVSIAAELVAAATAGTGGTVVGQEWLITVPTDLVYLQGNSDLNPTP